MVQIKLSVVFILAAAAIAPSFAEPVDPGPPQRSTVPSRIRERKINPRKIDHQQRLTQPQAPSEMEPVHLPQPIDPKLPQSSTLTPSTNKPGEAAKAEPQESQRHAQPSIPSNFQKQVDKILKDLQENNRQLEKSLMARKLLYPLPKGLYEQRLERGRKENLRAANEQIESILPKSPLREAQRHSEKLRKDMENYRIEVEQREERARDLAWEDYQRRWGAVTAVLPITSIPLCFSNIPWPIITKHPENPEQVTPEEISKFMDSILRMNSPNYVEDEMRAMQKITEWFSPKVFQPIMDRIVLGDKEKVKAAISQVRMYLSSKF